MSERPMIIGMPTTSRSRQRYDHRLRDLVQRTGDLSLATELGVPRSTAQGWLGAAPRAVVSLDVAHVTELELRQEILKLRRRVEKLAALLRLALAVLHASGFRLSGARLPDGPAKLRILRAVDRARVHAAASCPSVPGSLVEAISGLAPTADCGRGRDGLSPVGSSRPPHRSQRAALPHWALTSGSSIKTLLRPRV